MEQFSTTPNLSANKIRAWIFFNNMVVEAAKSIKNEQERIALYKNLPIAFEKIDDFSGFTQNNINSVLNRAKDRLSINHANLKQFLSKLPSMEKLQSYFSSPENTYEELAKRMSSLYMVDDVNLISSYQQLKKADEELETPQETDAFFSEKSKRASTREKIPTATPSDLIYVYNSANDPSAFSIERNNVLLEIPPVRELASGIYFAQIPNVEDEASLPNYINAMLDSGDGKGKKIEVALLLAAAEDVKPITKFLKKKYRQERTMKSFYEKNSNYDPRFSTLTINDFNDDSYFYVISDSRTRSQLTKSGTLKLYATDLIIAKDELTYLSRLWNLSQTQTISIQVKDTTDPANQEKAATIALAFKLVDEWVRGGWPESGKALSVQIAKVVNENEVCKNWIADSKDKKKLLADICSKAFKIYQATPVYGKQLSDDRRINRDDKTLQDVFVKTKKEVSNVTHVDAYAIEKTQHADKKTSKLTKFLGQKKKAEKTDFQLINQTAQHKLNHIGALRDFFVSNQFPISVRTLAKFYTLLNAALQDSVMYEERKTGITKTQGKAIGSLKQCLNSLEPFMKDLPQVKQDLTKLLSDVDFAQILPDEVSHTTPFENSKVEEDEEGKDSKQSYSLKFGNSPRGLQPDEALSKKRVSEDDAEFGFETSPPPVLKKINPYEKYGNAVRVMPIEGEGIGKTRDLSVLIQEQKSKERQPNASALGNSMKGLTDQNMKKESSPLSVASKDEEKKAPTPFD